MVQPWPMQEAKNKLSELVERAIHEGPQVISRRGTDTVVVISMEEYQRLTTPEPNLADFFASSPLAGVALELERDRDAGHRGEL